MGKKHTSLSMKSFSKYYLKCRNGIHLYFLVSVIWNIHYMKCTAISLSKGDNSLSPSFYCNFELTFLYPLTLLRWTNCQFLFNGPLTMCPHCQIHVFFPWFIIYTIVAYKEGITMINWLLEDSDFARDHNNVWDTFKSIIMVEGNITVSRAINLSW